MWSSDLWKIIALNKIIVVSLDVGGGRDKFLLAGYACFSRFDLDFVVGVLFHNFFGCHSELGEKELIARFAHFIIAREEITCFELEVLLILLLGF